MKREYRGVHRLGNNMDKYMWEKRMGFWTERFQNSTKINKIPSQNEYSFCRYTSIGNKKGI
jgi:hypothetical protein